MSHRQESEPPGSSVACSTKTVRKGNSANFAVDRFEDLSLSLGGNDLIEQVGNFALCITNVISRERFHRFTVNQDEEGKRNTLFISLCQAPSILESRAGRGEVTWGLILMKMKGGLGRCPLGSLSKTNSFFPSLQSLQPNLLQLEGMCQFSHM